MATSSISNVNVKSLEDLRQQLTSLDDKTGKVDPDLLGGLSPELKAKVSAASGKQGITTYQDLSAAVDKALENKTHFDSKFSAGVPDTLMQIGMQGISNSTIFFYPVNLSLIECKFFKKTIAL